MFVLIGHFARALAPKLQQQQRIPQLHQLHHRVRRLHRQGDGCFARSLMLSLVVVVVVVLVLVVVVVVMVVVVVVMVVAVVVGVHLCRPYYLWFCPQLFCCLLRPRPMKRNTFRTEYYHQCYEYSQQYEFENRRNTICCDMLSSRR